MRLKLFLFALLTIAATELAQSQCYPVYMQEATQNRDTTVFHVQSPNVFYTYTRKLDSTSRFSIVYHVLENGQWKDLNPLVAPTLPSLVKWGNKYIAYGQIDNFNQYTTVGTYGFIQYNNGVWDTLAGGMYNPGMMYIRVDCTEKDLWYLQYGGSLGSPAFLHKYDADSGRFIMKAAISFNYDYSPVLYGGKDRLLISNINRINDSLTYGFAFIENGVVHTNNYGNMGYHYSISRKNDEITMISGDKNTVVTTLSIDGNMISRNTKIPETPWMKYVTLGLERADDKLLWVIRGHQHDNIGNAWGYQQYHLVLCDGEKEWKMITYGQYDWGQPVFNDNRIYCHNFIDRLTYELTNGYLLKGRRFVDVDGDCRFDSGKDVSLAGHVLSIRKTGGSYKLYNQSDKDGMYEVFVGKDTLLLGAVFPFSPCMRDTLEIVSSIQVKDIAVKKPADMDIKADLMGEGRLRWNSKGKILARVINEGDIQDSLQFIFKCQKGLRILSAVGIPLKIINDTTGEGILYKLNYFESRTLQFNVEVDTAFSKFQDVKNMVLSVRSFGTEKDVKDNSDTARCLIVYSMDPNHKSCNADKIPVKTVRRLNYFIEFQNEGNDDAYDVVIIDSLKAGLNPATLVLDEASHPYTASIKNNVLKVSFRDIYLKPKSQDEALSQGFVNFNIETTDNMKDGSLISNKAYIYFDLNVPVITEDAVTLVGNKPVGIDVTGIQQRGLKVYPNPSGTSVTISGSLETIKIYNMQGVLMLTLPAGNELNKIDISAWSDGVYMIRSGYQSFKLVKVE